MIDQEQEFRSKKHWLDVECYYGRKHFCDGTPNISLGNVTKVRPPCPMRFDCEIKQKNVFKALEDKR